MKLRALSKRHRKEAILLLEKDREANLFQLDTLERRAFSSLFQDQWWGVFKDKTLVGINGCFGRPSHGKPARLLVPYGDERSLSLLGAFERDRGGTEMVLGCRSSADALLQGLRYQQYQTFYNQRIYFCTQVTELPLSFDVHFQRAQIQHEKSIVSMSAQMMLEDLGKDPRTNNPRQYQETIRRRIQEGRSFIGIQKNEIVFLLDLGTNGSRGCQIGGTYVPPKFRRRGIATQGILFWTKRLIQKYGVVTLHVNEENLPAIRCYQTVGFQQSSPYRLAIVKNLG